MMKMERVPGRSIIVLNILEPFVPRVKRVQVREAK